MTPQRRHWPADYYASATPDPVLPSGVAYGCGALSIVVLLVVFAGGALLTDETLAKFVDFSLGPALGEMRGMFTAEVTKEQKETLEREIEAMREQLRTRGIAIGDAQRFIRTLEKVTGDEKVTPDEVEQLTRVARETAARRPQSRKSAEPQREGGGL